MQIRHVGFAAAAWTAVTATAWGGEPETEAKPGDRPITIIASPSTLKVGARCRVELNPVTTGRSERVTVYDGVIVKANGQGVGLTVTEERTTIAAKSALAHTPLVNRLFRNVGIGRPEPREKKEVWLPSETIHSVKLMGKDSEEG